MWKIHSTARFTSVGRLLLTSPSSVSVESAVHIDCREVELPYFGRLIADVQDRTETAAKQAHTFRTMEIAIRAQMKADGL